MSKQKQQVPDNIITCDVRQMRRLLRFFIKNNMIACVIGPPGIGKTWSAKEIAIELSLRVWYFNALQEDVTDRKGAPWPNPEKKRVEWFPPDDLPFDEPNGLVLLDDFMQAVPTVQNGWSNIMSERRVGNRKLHPTTRFMITGNDVQHRAGSYQMPSNVARRVKIIYPIPKQSQWDEDFASKNNVHPMVRAYLRYSPNSIYIFPQSRDEKAFPNPHSWVDISDCIWAGPEEDLELYIFAASIGAGEAYAFRTFTKMYREFVNPLDILKDPNGTPIPKGMDVQWSIVAALSQLANKKNFSNIITYLGRMDEEFSALGVTMTTDRDKSLRDTPAYVQWSIKHPEVMAGTNF